MTPAPFKVRSEQESGVLVILVEGELDMSTATHDKRFALCGFADQVERVLDITGLDAAIPTHPSRGAALARLRH